MKPKKSKKSSLEDLAIELSHTLDEQLEIRVINKDTLYYKGYLIKKNKSGKWMLYNAANKDVVGDFFLKSCALLAAKAYYKINLNKYNQIKMLDNQYWANYMDCTIYQNNLKTTKDFERYLILLNKFEESTARAGAYKDEISRMFKWTFV
jgi:hypothetical protein